MAQTPEAKVKAWLTKRLKDLFPGAYYYRPPGGMFGRTGTPDLFILWRGVFVAIEVKADGNTATALQMKHLTDIKAAGGVAAIVTGKDEVKLMQIYKAVMDKMK